MLIRLTFLFLFLNYCTFAQRLDWQKVTDISAKPLAIAGDSTQLWAVVHNGIYTSRDTGLTWALSKDLTKKDYNSVITAAYGIENVLLVGIKNYTTNHTGCVDYLELKKFDKGQEMPYVAGASLCSVSSRFCPPNSFGDGPFPIDATHFSFKNGSSSLNITRCTHTGTTKILSEPNKYTLNIDNYYSLYDINSNSGFSQDSGLVMAISDRKWLVSMRNSTHLMYFKFDTVSNLKYNFQSIKPLPIQADSIKRYLHKNNRLYLLYGGNKFYFTDNFGDNWQQDSLSLKDVQDIQVWDSTFIILCKQGLYKSFDLVSFSPIYQNGSTLADSIRSFPFRIGQFYFAHSDKYGLLRSLNKGETWQHIEPYNLGYPSVLKAYWRGGDTITVKGDDLFFTKTSPDTPFEPDTTAFALCHNEGTQVNFNNYTFRTVSIYEGSIKKELVLRSNNLRWDTILTIIDPLARGQVNPKIKTDRNKLFFLGSQLRVSEDEGNTWQLLFNKSVSQLFIAKDSLLIMADSVYFSNNFGRTWAIAYTFNSYSYLSDLAELWANKQILMPTIPFYHYADINFSLNFGRTWFNRQPPPNCFSVAVALSTPNFREYKTYNYAYPYFSDSRFLYGFSRFGGLWRAKTEGFALCNDNNPIKISATDSICSNSFYNFGGVTYTQTGIYTRKKESNFDNTCDTLFTLNLKVKDIIYRHQIADTICAGTFYSFNGRRELYPLVGTFYRNFRSSNCDTLTVLTLTVVNTPACRIQTDEILAINNLTIAPNPNTGAFSIDFELKEAEEISIELTDAAGKLVKSLVKKTYFTPNTYQIPMQINDVSNGFYFLHFRTLKGSLVRKIIKTD